MGEAPAVAGNEVIGGKAETETSSDSDGIQPAHTVTLGYGGILQPKGALCAWRVDKHTIGQIKGFVKLPFISSVLQFCSDAPCVRRWST
jgi:hypothetical protein